MDQDESSAIESDQSWRLAKNALLTSPIHVLRNLEIEKTGASLILTGTVHSFYEKQLAQELIRNVVGACELVNSVDVEDEVKRASRFV